MVSALPALADTNDYTGKDATRRACAPTPKRTPPSNCTRSLALVVSAQRVQAARQHILFQLPGDFADEAELTC